MAYHIYDTEAVVLGAYESGESNRIIDVLTEELGRVRAIARGVRKEESKLRFHTQPGMVSRLALVRGKEYWRITGAERGTTFSFSPDSQVCAYRILSLIRKLVGVDNPTEALFGICKESMCALGGTEDTSRIDTIEILAVLQILHSLGYIGDSSALRGLLSLSLMGQSELPKLGTERSTVISAINEALKETGI